MWFPAKWAFLEPKNRYVPREFRRRALHRRRPQRRRRPRRICTLSPEAPRPCRAPCSRRSFNRSSAKCERLILPILSEWTHKTACNALPRAARTIKMSSGAARQNPPSLPPPPLSPRRSIARFALHRRSIHIKAMKSIAFAWLPAVVTNNKEPRPLPRGTEPLRGGGTNEPRPELCPEATAKMSTLLIKNTT